MLRSAFTFCCGINRALVGHTGGWTRELVQVRAMRGSMLLPILFLFQGEIELAGKDVNHRDDVLLSAVTSGLSLSSLKQTVYAFK